MLVSDIMLIISIISGIVTISFILSEVTLELDDDIDIDYIEEIDLKQQEEDLKEFFFFQGLNNLFK